MLQLSHTPFIGLIQAFLSQLTALTVLLIGQIQPVQTARTAAQCISLHKLALWTNVGVLLFIIAKSIPLQFNVRAAMKRLRPVYDALHKQLCRELVLHADEMTLWVLKEPERSSTSKFYMWQSPIGATRSI